MLSCCPHGGQRSLFSRVLSIPHVSCLSQTDSKSILLVYQNLYYCSNFQTILTCFPGKSPYIQIHTVLFICFNTDIRLYFTISHRFSPFLSINQFVPTFSSTLSQPPFYIPFSRQISSISVNPMALCLSLTAFFAPLLPLYILLRANHLPLTPPR